MGNIDRRGFLQKSSAAAIGTALTSLTASTATAESDIPDEIEDDDGRGTTYVIRSTDSTEFHHPYLLFKPDPAPQTERPLFIAASAITDVSSPEEALDDAVSGHPIHKIGWSRFWAAKDNRLPGLVPLFPTTPNDGPTYIRGLVLPSYRSDKLHQNYQLEDLATDGYSAESLTRVDKQLAAMIDDAKSRLSDESYPVADQVHVDGFSAGGDFMTRFAFLYPHRVSTLTAGGGGFAPLPKASITVEEDKEVELPYPLGTADYKDLTGREFDIDEWNSINQFFYLGENDEPHKQGDEVGAQAPSTRDTDRGFEVFGRERVTSMFVKLQEVYNDVGASATFKLYEDTGHEITREMMDDMISFHSRKLVEEYDVVDISAEKSTSEVKVGEPVVVTVSAANRTAAEAVTTLTLATNGSEAETVDVQIRPNQTETTELETTFDEAGEYTLEVNEIAVGEPVIVTEERTETATEGSSTDETASSENSNSTPEETSTEDQPGFSIMQSAAALGGFSYLIKRRMHDDG